MGLLKRLLGGRTAGSRSSGPNSQFHDSETTTQHATPENAPRRELVQVVLRDTMRKHGIPSDWMDCRILSVSTQKGQTGMHVQFIVRQGDDRLLPFVHAFQDTFWQELEKFESNPHTWLLSVAWQFDGLGTGVPAQAMADGWDDDTQPPPPDTLPPEQDSAELASDLQALYAIRDAALSEPAPLSSMPRAKGPGGN
jgi:hypothetical protein